MPAWLGSLFESKHVCSLFSVLLDSLTASSSSNGSFVFLGEGNDLDN
jgi:hypothetical protein